MTMLQGMLRRVSEPSGYVVFCTSINTKQGTSSIDLPVKRDKDRILDFLLNVDCK